MNADLFWTIIGDTHDQSLSANKEKLFRRLCTLSEEEIIAFNRLWSEHYWQLYTWPLWGTAYLFWGWCSDDSFMDWRNWVISCGQQAFETARDRPDDLLPLIEAEPEAGEEGIHYVVQKALQTVNPAWDDAWPEETIIRPERPSGPTWKDQSELKPLLPRIYARYVENLTPKEKNWRDPDWIKNTFNPRLGKSESFQTLSEEVTVNGQKGRRTTLIPIRPNPWWKFWG